MNDWDILDLHFKDHKYPFTNHHLDSYREFIKNYIPKIIKDENPITMIKFNENANKNKEEYDESDINVKVDVYIGGENSDLIYIDHPITIENGIQKIITPNDARLKSITYDSHIYTDVVIKIKNKNGDLFEQTIEKVAIGSIPIMLHSDICILNNNGNKVLRELGECIYDGGGYFIIDGKEKVIIAQETETNNRLIVSHLNDDDDFSFKGKIKCSGETGESVLVPRMIEFYLVKTDGDVTENFSDNRGAIYVTLTSIEGKIPLFILFRALGIESDKDIYETIFGSDNTNVETSYFQNFIRPSIYNNFYVRESDKEKVYIYTQEQALEYIKFRCKFKEDKYVKYLLSADILPNISLFENKGKYLGYLVKEFINIAIGIKKESDRDNYYNKRIYISGILLAELFQQSYKRLKKTIRDTMDNIYYYNGWKNKDDYNDFITKDNIYRVIPNVLIADAFAKSLKGRWGLDVNENGESGKVQDLSRISYIGFLSHLRRVNMPIDRTIKVTAPHKLHSHQWGIMCPFESPDGEAIGYLKNLAFLAKVTAGTNPEYIRECLLDIGVIPIENYNLKLNRNITKVFINNTWFGLTNDPIRIMRTLRAYKRNALINILTSILWNNSTNEIMIYVDKGRAVRPLIILNNGKTNIFQNKYNNWFELIIGKYNNYKEKQRNEEIYYKDQYINPRTLDVFNKKSDEEILELLESDAAVIEYIDPQESDSCYIAMTKADINNFHTHLEINPSMMLSVVSGNIPMCNHNQSARNVFHAAQTKQAIGIYATNFNKRFDTFGYIQHYPQKAIINTRHAQYTGSDMMPNGANLIVAIMTYTGFNQEDSLIINKRSIERGLFHLSYYKTISESTKKINDYERVIFANPLKFKEKLKEEAEKNNKTFKNFDFKLKNARYDLLDDDGCIKEGSYIPKGQKAVIIGKILIKEVLRETKNGLFTEQEKVTMYIDQSIVSDDTYFGYVNKIHKDKKPNVADDIKVWKVRFMKIKIPEFGDKHSSRHGQKGVIGMILPEEQMPFTKDGVRPDLIVNPHAIPSRMTIGHLVECVYAKLCCLEGFLGDGTVYINLDYEKIYNQLEKYDFNSHGNEILYNGQTGKQMNTEIFIGPTYYFRLKHMVAEKINARGTGPTMQLTRQPTGGRRNAGGLRIGEMERDSLISHGISRFIKESMMERSDKYRWRVCNNCGTIPVYNSKIKNSYCKNCGNTQINTIETPYSFKLLNQEFEPMGVQIRYNCDNVDIPFEEHSDEIAESLFETKASFTIIEEEKEEKPKKTKVTFENKEEILKEIKKKFKTLKDYESLSIDVLKKILTFKKLKDVKEYLSELQTNEEEVSDDNKEEILKEIKKKFKTLKDYESLSIDVLKKILTFKKLKDVKEYLSELQTNEEEISVDNKEEIINEIKKKFKTLKDYESESVDILKKILTFDKLKEVKEYLSQVKNKEEKPMSITELKNKIKEKFPDLKKYTTKTKNVLEQIYKSKTLDEAKIIVGGSSSDSDDESEEDSNEDSDEDSIDGGDKSEDDEDSDEDSIDGGDKSEDDEDSDEDLIDGGATTSEEEEEKEEAANNQSNYEDNDKNTDTSDTDGREDTSDSEKEEEKDMFAGGKKIKQNNNHENDNEKIKETDISNNIKIIDI